MSSGRASTPVGRAAKEKLNAKSISPEGSDSGYGSGSTTEHLQDFADGVALPSRSFFERKVTKLKIFDKEIPQLTQQRFHDLHELFEKPLCESLIEAKVNPNPISIKLKTLGESEATAKPWIVVLCNKLASKKIRHFFNQRQIKAAYQPSDPDSSLPSFEILIRNRPPRPMAGTEIYGEYDERATTCGKLIKVGEADQSRFATLGGVIRVFKPPGTVTLYGMTAGHILAQQPLGQESFDQASCYSEEDDEEYELEDWFEGDKEVQDSTTTGNTSPTVSQSTQVGQLWPKVGFVAAASNEGTTTGRDLDWALIDFDNPADYRPNFLVLSDREGETRNRPLKGNAKFTEDGPSRPVSLLSSTGSVKSGTLSISLSFLMMGPAKAFAKTYTLRLPHGSVLNAGDCGSWVVDPSTCEVYGHVVASDAMGDTYVVPLNATLRDMEEKLGAAVSLPTEADIRTWLTQHAKTSVKPVAIPERSQKKKVAFNNSEMDTSESPRDLRRLAGHLLSRASTSPAPSAIKTSTPIAEHCSSCNAEFRGTSHNVQSNLQRHLRTCPKQNKGSASKTESFISQNAKDISDESSKSSSVKNIKDGQPKTTDNTSTQQTNSVPHTIRSMYSSFRKRSSTDSAQKDGEKGKVICKSKENKSAGSAFSKKQAATASPTSTAKGLKNNTKSFKSKNEAASSPISKGLPAPPLATAGRIDWRPAPPAPPVIPGLSVLFPIGPPSRLPQNGRLLGPPTPYVAPPLVHAHESPTARRSDPRHLSHNSDPGQVSYEGYAFTKCSSNHTGQKETWAVARMAPMPVSQADLKDQIKRNRKKHISALDEYNDPKMKGFKRKQVDRLIQERTSIDGDYGYEYLIASIKLDSRKTNSKTTETVSMQVILKRQLRANFPHEPSARPPMDFHARLPSQVMDLTGGDERGNVRDSGGGGEDVGRGGHIVSFAGRPEHGALPMSPSCDQAFGHGVQNFDDRLPPFHAAPHSLDSLDAPAEAMRQPSDPHSVPIIYQKTNDTQNHSEKVNKSKQKEKKAPKVSHIKPETRKKRDYLSDPSSLSESSFDRDSDNSWAKTDATPDTVFSGESREHRKVKISEKESKARSYDEDKIELKPYAQERARPVYHEHRRAERRRSSLSPARRSSDLSPDSIHSRQDQEMDLERHDRSATSRRYSYGPRYREHGRYDVEPAISFRADRLPRHCGSSVSPERVLHRRALSYDFDRPLTHDSRALTPTRRRPAVYRETPRDFSRAVDGYDPRVKLEEEWERERFHETELYEARAKREMETHDRKERDLRMERMRETERRERLIAEERGWPRRTTYDDNYTYDDFYIPRRHRDPRYYY